MKKSAILLIYTGGTIGMVREGAEEKLVPFNFENMQRHIPELQSLDAEVTAISFEQPLDSSNIHPTDWQHLAKIIAGHYADYDGFVVLHGTDTMAYTASALSFMLQNLAKPVVFTGSQLPIGMVRTDGRENLITAIEIAAAQKDGKPVVPEVSIYFQYGLYRANRTVKYNAENFQAFQSPNYPLLAQAGIHITYYGSSILPFSEKPLEVKTGVSNKVDVLTLFPGISEAMVRAALELPGNQVLIMRTFGSGNAMTAGWFLKLLEKATANGLQIINLTQCLAGGVDQGRYETSSAFNKIGIISGRDMTFEAALTKTMHLLGQPGGAEGFAQKIGSAISGEMTVDSGRAFGGESNNIFSDN